MSYSTVAFDHRLKNKRYQKYTLKQLRQEAQRRNLDTSDLSHKWQLVHVIEANRLDSSVDPRLQGSKKINPNRRGWSDLPGELRNQIYDLSLLSDDYTSACALPGFQNVYSEGRRIVHTTDRATRVDDHIRAFTKLSQISYKLRHEAASIFFTNNRILFSLNQNIRPEHYSAFFTSMSGNPRKYITKVAFEGRFDELNHVSEWRGLDSLLKGCIHLKDMELLLDPQLRTWVCGCSMCGEQGPPSHLLAFLQAMQDLEHSEGLNITCVRGQVPRPVNQYRRQMDFLRGQKLVSHQLFLSSSRNLRLGRRF